MQQTMKKGMRRLCGMMLAVILAMTSVLPAFGSEPADEEKVKRTAFSLEAGDILQPGEELAFEDWQSKNGS